MAQQKENELRHFINKGNFAVGDRGYRESSFNSIYLAEQITSNTIEGLFKIAQYWIFVPPLGRAVAYASERGISRGANVCGNISLGSDSMKRRE